MEITLSLTHSDSSWSLSVDGGLLDTLVELLILLHLSRMKRLGGADLHCCSSRHSAHLRWSPHMWLLVLGGAERTSVPPRSGVVFVGPVLAEMGHHWRSASSQRGGAPLSLALIKTLGQAGASSSSAVKDQWSRRMDTSLRSCDETQLSFSLLHHFSVSIKAPSGPQLMAGAEAGGEEPVHRLVSRTTFVPVKLMMKASAGRPA